MIDIKALRQQKADLVNKNAGLLEAAETANRDLTAAETAEYDANRASIASLNTRIVRAEQQMDEERNLPASAGIRVVHDNREDKPWASLAEQLQAIKLQATSKGAQVDPRLHAASLGGNEDVDSEGGFLIAPEFAPGVWQRTYEASQLAKLCFDQPMTNSNRLVVNAVDEDSRVDGSRWGGVLSYWLGESGTFTPTQPKFRQMELIAKKLIVLSYATDEQLVDGPAWAAYVDKVVPLELAFQADNNIYNGTGAGTPLGFMNSGALLTIAKASGDSGAVVSNTDVFNMWGQAWAPSRKNMVWFINQNVEPQLWNLTRGSGTAVELLYHSPGDKGSFGDYGGMMGRPVIPVEYAATLGTPGDLVLADLTQYCLARRSGVQMDTSIHVQFLTDQMAFRWKTRLDGQPFWKKPLTPKNGTLTLSPFVALATRS
jgi:HK97 family phage major capsid protein